MILLTHQQTPLDIEAMGSIDADVEIDMEISDDEQESSTGRAVAGQVVDGRVVNQTSPVGPTITKEADSTRKRKRSSPEETSPSVRVKYHNLTRDSRKKLQELLRDWSLWQGYHGDHLSSESRDNRVENGEEQYYAALQVGPIGSSFSVSFWVDKPAKQSCRKEYGDSQGIFKTPSKDLGESESDVPLYDRVTPSLSTQELRKDGNRIELLGNSIVLSPAILGKKPREALRRRKRTTIRCLVLKTMKKARLLMV